MAKSPPEAKNRNDRIMALRAEGLSYNKIMRQLIEEGYEEISTQRVQKIVKVREAHAKGMTPREAYGWIGTR